EKHIKQASKDSPDKYGDEFFRQLRALGLIKRDNQGETAEFAHLTFQEFFAARYIAKRIEACSQKYDSSFDELIKFITTRKHDTFYEVMWWFVAGLLANSHSIQESKKRLELLQIFFDFLLQEPRDKIEVFELPLLASCLAEANMPSIVQANG